MFRVREGLKLARATGCPIRQRFCIFRGLFQNPRQKLRLRRKTFRLQPGGFAGGLNRGKIDVRGEVLLADVRQKVVGGVMAKIRAERAARPARRKQFVIGQAVINRHQPSAFQNVRRFTPPVFGGGTDFDGVAVGKHLQKRRREMEMRWKMAISDGSGIFAQTNFSPSSATPHSNHFLFLASQPKR